MEIRCPHCGKSQNLSRAELMASNGVVICPQCVSEFVIDLDEAPLDEITPQPASSSAAATTTAATAIVEGITFCPHCGKNLPASGLNFCPFCGQTLNFSAPQLPADDAPSQPAGKTPPEEETAKTSEPATDNSATSNSKNGDKELIDMPYVKPLSQRDIHREEPASLRYSIFAWVVIAILVATFVVLVVLGNKAP